MAAAVGVVGLLAPLPALRSEAQRAGALAVMIVSWGILLASLVPGRRRPQRARPARLARGAGAAAVAVIVALVVAVLVVRAILARPTIWFVLLGIALPIRIPVSLGSQEGNLLVPLYAVVLLGLAAWIWGRVRGSIEAPAPEGPGGGRRAARRLRGLPPGVHALEQRRGRGHREGGVLLPAVHAPLRPGGGLVAAGAGARRPGDHHHRRGRDRRRRRPVPVRDPRDLVERDALAGQRLQPLLPRERDLLRPQHPGPVPGARRSWPPWRWPGCGAARWSCGASRWPCR